MNAAPLLPFDGRAAFAEQLRLCFAGAQRELLMFDPDFSLWGLDSAATELELRRLLAGGGRLRLVAHDTAWLQRYAARFVRLLADFSHAVECRRSGKGLRQLSDSFCIGDGRDLVRRFHSDHLRGEASFGQPAATEPWSERFAGIWSESVSALQPFQTGL